MKHLLGLLRSRKNIQGASLVLADLFYHGFAKQEEIELNHQSVIKFLGVDVTPQWVSSKLKILEDVGYIERLNQGKKIIIKRGQSFKDLCGGSVVEVLNREVKKEVVSKEILEENYKKRRFEFIKKVAEYREKYDKIVLENFVSYWTEPNPRTFVMRFEQEDTFGISRRLATLANQDWMKQKLNQKEVVRKWK